METDRAFLCYYYHPLSAGSLRYYDALTKLMDYVSRTPCNEAVVYIINLEDLIYKIYDSNCRCIFVCDVSSPDLLLNAILNLMPEKLIFLNNIGKKISAALILLFDCIQC